MSVGQLNVSTACDIGPVRSGLGEFRGLVGMLDASLWDADKAIGKVDKSFMAIAGAAGAGVSALGAVAFAVGEVKASFTRLDELGDKASTLGIKPERLAELGHAAKMSGADLGIMTAGLGQMNRRLAEAAQGDGKAIDALRELGLSARSLNAMPVDQKFAVIADKIAAIQNPSDQARLAFKLLGSQGLELLDTLRLGSSGLADMAVDANKLGSVVSGTDIAKLQQANDAMDRMRTAVEGVANAFAIEFADSVEKAAGLLADVVSSDQFILFLKVATGMGTLDVAMDGISGMGARGLKVDSNKGVGEEPEAKLAEGADAERLQAAEKLTEEYEKQLAALQKEHAIARDGKIAAAFAEEELKFGRLAAEEMRRERIAAEGWNNKQRQLKEQADEAERQRKERLRDQEQKREQAERKWLERQKRDAEALQKLRDRVADFGKTDLQKDRDELLRTITDFRQRAEVMRHFQTLEGLQRGKDDLKQLQEDRKNLAGRGDDKMLDARSAEGWAALRSSAKDLQLVKMDQQIELMKESNRLAAERAGQEVIKF